MPTDNERREVARRLRETGEELGSAALLWYHIAKALGVRTATDGKTACGMLADLIEPPLQCPYYHSDRHYCSIHEGIQPIDRGAERTCHVESSHEVEGDGCYAYFEYELSCGHEVALDDQLPPSYCPECGRMVLYDSNDYI